MESAPINKTHTFPKDCPCTSDSDKALSRLESPIAYYLNLPTEQERKKFRTLVDIGRVHAYNELNGTLLNNHNSAIDAMSGTEAAFRQQYIPAMRRILSADPNFANRAREIAPLDYVALLAEFDDLSWLLYDKLLYYIELTNALQPHRLAMSEIA